MIIRENINFTQEECELIINLEKINAQKWQFTDRNYNSELILLSEKTEWIFKKLKTFFETATGLNVVKVKEEIHFHKYVPGDMFNKHNDAINGREFAIGTLLNSNFEGGDFKLYNNNETTLNKETGNTYVFDVKIDHQVMPILKGVRYSILWFLHAEHIKHTTKSLI